MRYLFVMGGQQRAAGGYTSIQTRRPAVCIDRLKNFQPLMKYSPLFFSFFSIRRCFVHVDSAVCQGPGNRVTRAVPGDLLGAVFPAFCVEPYLGQLVENTCFLHVTKTGNKDFRRRGVTCILDHLSVSVKPTPSYLHHSNCRFDA